ncbi:GNAT family N-acetyltransferase [Flavobacterium wongokense]|uniref:GNAT family N-acetyltransferase n=1 Tax=Flavobacterium wongokense TaxID=2910674 RepID=UPI001F4552AC|nr:GNAT family N-acetyltransferase [Flavobacterium sp. WG47]MCF6132547.1 GNAT family N-acetyltransferase [Flavobacterium sp. WG47]
MQIHTLENTSIEELTTCFNKAFEGYFIPLKLEVQQLRDKIQSENILLEHSVGVTINNELAGFILLGINSKKNIGYNAGTGIIPDYRGMKLTEKMYPHVISNLSKIGIKNHFLEVICENQKALKIYENLGYTITRKVICYKGKVAEPKKTDYKIQSIELPDESLVQPFWNHHPTYQNSLGCIKSNSEKHTAFGVLNGEKLIGYIIFDKNTLRIKQFGVDKTHRNTGIGKQLFHTAQNQNPEAVLAMINVDENDLETTRFLTNIGLSPFIAQYEMQLND